MNAAAVPSLPAGEPAVPLGLAGGVDLIAAAACALAAASVAGDWLAACAPRAAPARSRTRPVVGVRRLRCMAVPVFFRESRREGTEAPPPAWHRPDYKGARPLLGRIDVRLGGQDLAA